MNFFNRALFIEQIKRFWAIPALALLWYFLVSYLPLLQWSGSPWRRIDDIVAMRNLSVPFALVITPVLAAFCTFGFYFNKKRATAFYSFPLNKAQLFATNVLAGVVLSIIPVLVFSIMMMPFAGIEAILFLIMASLVTVFYFAVACFAFSLAGHSFVALCLVAVVPFVPVALVGVTEMVGSMFVFGFSGLFDGNVMDLFFIYHTPAAWGALLRGGYSFAQSAVYPVISYVLIAVGLFAAAFFIGRARRPERTGDSVIFTPIKHLLVFLFSYVGMWFVGIIFFAVGRERFTHMNIGLVIGFVISYIVAQMIAEKTFLVLNKMKYLPIFGGMAIGIYVVMLIVTQFGLGFYVNRIPSNVYGVYVSNTFLWGGLSNEEWRNLAFTDPDLVEATRTAHRTILDERRRLHRIPHVNMGSYRRVHEDGTVTSRENIFIKYILNNGRIVLRQYSITSDFIADTGFYEFLNAEHVILAPYSILRNPEEINRIRMTFTGGDINEPLEIVEFDRARIAEIVEIVSQGMVENTRYMRSIAGQSRIRDENEIRVRLSFITTREAEGPGRLGFFRQPHIFGEPVERLFESLPALPQ
ncbi:MAG: hypothetical protein FWF78_10200 [Defluviitaleaceae bacterium]|nr:hypothetical protein [Defluviitaleaceae bacterium]